MLNPPLNFVPSTCVDDTCMDSVVVSSYCPQANKITVALRAANQFGYGPTSDAVIVGMFIYDTNLWEQNTVKSG